MLNNKRCLPCEGLSEALSDKKIKLLVSKLKNWSLLDHEKNGIKKIQKIFAFKNYTEVILFSNAVAWMAHVENHHPDILLEYHQCAISYHTHAVKGLSENDFICAAKIDNLYSGVEKQGK